MKNKKFEYDVKCRKCGKITRVWFGRDVGMDEARFKEWAKITLYFCCHYVRCHTWLLWLKFKP